MEVRLAELTVGPSSVPKRVALDQPPPPGLSMGNKQAPGPGLVLLDLKDPG